MSEETRQLQSLVEEAAYVFGATRTEEHRARLLTAWADYNEAYRSDVVRDILADSLPIDPHDRSFI